MADIERSVEIVTKIPAKVQLVASTEKPERLVANLCRVFAGKTEFSWASPNEINTALGELLKTDLQGPLEFVHFAFLIQDVTRAFTHQLVRYRVGVSYVQESLRFSVKNKSRVLCLAEDSDQVSTYADAAAAAMKGYWDLLDAGAPAEVARGLLPTNILTSIYFDCSLRTLIHVYEQRACVQAQHGEWGAVLSQMKAQLRLTMPKLADMMQMRCERKPGECLFASTWDRPCPYRV